MIEHQVKITSEDIISEEILSLPVQGSFLEGSTFGESLGTDTVLLAFLRHFGCSVCREMVSDLREAALSIPGYPKVIIVHQGTVAEGDAFFNRHWKAISAIADPSWKLYRAFHVKRGNMRELFGPGAISSGIRSLLRGNSLGVPMGDPFLMPGLFAVKKNEIVWKHHFRHIGDKPDYTTIPNLIAG